MTAGNERGTLSKELGLLQKVVSATQEMSALQAVPLEEKEERAFSLSFKRLG